MTNRDSMREPMRGADAVFHLAGWYAVGIRRDEISRMREINVDGARNVLELAAELGVPKIMHTSTVGVFGNTHGKIVDERIRGQDCALRHGEVKFPVDIPTDTDNEWIPPDYLERGMCLHVSFDRPFELLALVLVGARTDFREPDRALTLLGRACRGS